MAKFTIDLMDSHWSPDEVEGDFAENVAIEWAEERDSDGEFDSLDSVSGAYTKVSNLETGEITYFRLRRKVIYEYNACHATAPSEKQDE